MVNHGDIYILSTVPRTLTTPKKLPISALRTYTDYSLETS